MKKLQGKFTKEEYQFKNKIYLVGKKAKNFSAQIAKVIQEKQELDNYKRACN